MKQFVCQVGLPDVESLAKTVSMQSIQVLSKINRKYHVSFCAFSACFAHQTMVKSFDVGHFYKKQQKLQYSHHVKSCRSNGSIAGTHLAIGCYK